MKVSFTLKVCATPHDIARFIRFPYQLYRGHPHWVPLPLVDRKVFFDREKNPFFLHSKAEYFLAQRGGRVVGRIAAIHNTRHNQFHKDSVGFWGCFECVEDQHVADALFDAAREWLRARGLNVMRGPMNFSTNDDCGLLVDAFDRDPVFMMPYNPPYYVDLVEAYGFVKAKDLLAFWVDDSAPIPERMIHVSDRLMKRKGVTVRTINMKDIDREVQRIREVYNNAWSLNWGFVPMTEEEFAHYAKDLRQVVDPEMVFFAEYGGRPVGFALSLPDLSPVFKRMKGRLFPFGVVHFLRRRRIVKGVRVLVMGVIDGFRHRGIEAAFIVETFRRGLARGYKYAELSWLLEDNEPILAATENAGGKRYKTYRVYDIAV